MQRLGMTHLRLVIDSDDWEGTGGWNEQEPYPRLAKALFAWQERWGLRHCDHLTVASRTLESIAWSLGIPPQRVTYLPNGITVCPPGNGQAVRSRHGLGNTPIVLLYTRFFECPADRLARLARGILQGCPTAHLLIVGRALHQGDDAFLEWLGEVAPRVVAVGWRPKAELPDYFAAADVAIVPTDDTLILRARCSAKLADLLGAGVPVVAHRVGEQGEMIQHLETGILVDPSDDAAFVQWTLTLLQDRTLAQRLGRAARELLVRQRSWDVLARQAEEIYQKVHS